MKDEQWKQEQLQRIDDARRAGRLERVARTRVHELIPYHFFSPASSECRDAFIDGHYYACVSLAQAVAEGLARFLNGFHRVGAKNDPQKMAFRLKKAGAISDAALNAFLRIWGNDRNTFHHVNTDIPTDGAELERRAEECIHSLYEIESELFAYTSNEGRIIPKNDAYWPKVDQEHLQVFLRASH